MTPPPDDAIPLADQAEEVFVQLLADWDERNASGKSTAAQLAVEDTSIAATLRERLEKARNCVKLLNQLWPKPLPPRSTNGSARNGGQRAYARFGRYEIIRELGRGGHGVVFLAADSALKRHVALKVPRPEVLSSDELRLRFLREAEATARLDHPNILPVFEVGSEGPICFTAAAYCDGGTLQDWLARGRAPLAPREAAQIVAELATAIHHAHTRGVLHRDLKPSNVLLASRNQDVASAAGENVSNSPPPPVSRSDQACQPLLVHWVLKIADFGLAKVVDGQQDSTMNGVVMGTANYMAPEQAAGRSADVGVTTDVYSLGVILYELLTGAPPFLAASHLATLKRVEADEAAWPSKIRRRIPVDLRTICLTCLEKDPAKRYASAAALAGDLNRFVRGEPVTARPLSLVQRLRRTVNRHPALSLLTVAAVCLSIGFVVQLFLHNRTLGAKNAELAQSVQRDREQTKLAQQQTKLAHEQAALAGQQTKIAQEKTLLAQKMQRLAEERAEENRRRSFGAKLRVVEQFANADSLRQMTEALHETIPQDDEQDLREFAWRYWWHRCRRGEVFRLPGHGQHVHDAVFSPDGRLIATGSSDATVRVWDYETGRELARLHGLDATVTKVSFSPGGTLLAASSSLGQIKVWSTAGWQPRDPLQAHEGEIRGLVFGSEETLISGGADGWLRAWDLKTFTLAHEYHLANSRYVQCLAIAPRSKLLLVGVHNGEIQLRSISDVRHRIGIWKGHDENVVSIAVSLQEDRVFSSDPLGDLRVWDVAAGQSIPMIDDGPYHSSPTAISPDGRWLAAVADGGKVQVLSAATGKVEWERYLDIDVVGALEFSKDGDAILAAGADGQVVLWRPFDARPAPPEGHLPEAWTVAFAPDGATFITGGDNGTVRQWSTADGKLLGELLKQEGTVSAAAFSPDGKILATGSLEEMAQRPDNVRLWNMPEGDLRFSLKGHSDKVYSAAFHPRQDVLATGAREVILWNARDGKRIGMLVDSRTNNKKVRSIAFSAEGSLLAFGSEDGNTYLYNYPSLTLRTVLESGGQVWALAFFPDGTQLAAGNWDGSVAIWCPQTLGCQFTLKGHLQGIHCVAFTHDGQTIATGSNDRTIKLWGPKTGQEFCTLHGHQHEVFGLAFSADDQWLASCSYDGGVKLWHAPRLRTPFTAPATAGAEEKP